ncbi:lipoprotein LpqH [Mycobacterium montefiorense]|uniref:lipoprotein LpqH n=1 Tax=Mycobacterium montefiorense TaxID=154654 RepID=UPI0021DC2A46|nr:lipoprotein LpqH [Mycobacterium montefiorense]MCV7425732.1 lipoprotein LpqH [Mycobacterium montefiorense]GLE53102.1 putative lipoprotein LppE [Mycobacterium montefiorense]
MQYRLVAVGFALVAGVAGCAEPQTTPRAAAHLTIDGTSHAARPAACSQLQSYRTIDIRDRDGQVEAVVLFSASRVIPQWVKIRNINGFTGSFWQGGVGEAHADATNSAYTISGSAYGINNSNPNKVITTDFKITADC